MVFGGLIGLFIILIFIGAVSGGVESDQVDAGPKITSGDTSMPALAPINTDSPTPTNTIAPTPTPTFRELREQAITINYDDLFRNNEQYVGRLVSYRSKIVQVMNDKQGGYQLRAEITQGTNSWDDTVFLRYSGPRLLDGDIVDFVGTVRGLVTYKAVMGNEITIPEINIIQSQLIANASGPIPTSVPDRTATPAPTMPGTVTPIPAKEPVKLLGTGQQATSKFVLRSGLVLFEMDHDGQSNFAVQLLDSHGERVSTLANEIGPFDGSKAVGIKESGTYILDISADGNWTINIEQ